MSEGTANSTFKRKIDISRDIFTQGDVEAEHPKTVNVRSISEKIKSGCTCTKRDLWKILTTFLPIIKFIKNYNIKGNLLNDMLSGLTVSFMHLPQGMGFGLLASLEPINGIYATFFPVLIYLFFGTSPHISIGTNAVMALLTQNVVEREADLYISSFGTGTAPDSMLGNTTTPTLNDTGHHMPTDADILQVKIGAAMTSSLIVGLMLAGLGVLRLGFLTMYLSVSFVSGFTTAAAVHIASSQVPKIFGIKVPAHAGAGRLVKMYIDLFSNIEETKAAEITISIVCIIILLLVKICINERFKSRMRIPIPIDLIVVVLGTIVSHFANFSDELNVKVVGDIPSGFPSPSVPSLSSGSRIVMDCFVMAILSLAMTISMAKLTANMHGTVIDDNQELLAYGLCNIGSSFFYSFPQATAPPRTMLLSSMGAKTTLNAISTSIFMLLVLLWIGQLFVSLPVSVLAAMIVVAMKELLMQVQVIPRYWRISRRDCFIWILTFSVSVLVDLDYGIIVGVGISVLFVVIQHQLASGQLLGVARKSNILIDMKNRDGIERIPNMAVFRFEAPLYYANAERFKNQIYSKIVNPLRFKKDRAKLAKLERSASKSNGISGKTSPLFTVNSDQNCSISKENLTNGSQVQDMDILVECDNEQFKTRTCVSHVIIDCHAMYNIDLGGIGVLKQVIKEYNEIDICTYFARCPANSLANLEAADFFKTFSRKKVFFDIVDAIKSIQTEQEIVEKKNETKL